MSKNKKYIYITIVIIQVLFLLFMVYSKHNHIEKGKKIILKVNPVDPRSIMRGEYIRLTYDFSELEIKLENKLPKGEAIYIILKNNLNVWSYNGYSLKKPEKNLTFIKGHVKYSYAVLDNEKNKKFKLFINFGIEDYYVEEGKAIDYENKINNEDLYVKVSLNSNGEGIVYGILEEK
ncbi:MAG: GDYXXLXY domain-containing protein [Candidatus Muirbacterium halophilum]|nr:GDYXXLXY domain-containing protein [Candidatus Muirbacterium halophilum]MCK9477450.1 GDYXXLXY domain-containing protein [Candidatus Muirbacterium halophilum]